MINKILFKCAQCNFSLISRIEIKKWMRENGFIREMKLSWHYPQWYQLTWLSHSNEVKVNKWTRDFFLERCVFVKQDEKAKTRSEKNRERDRERIHRRRFYMLNWNIKLLTDFDAYLNWNEYEKSHTIFVLYSVFLLIFFRSSAKLLFDWVYNLWV